MNYLKTFILFVVLAAAGYFLLPYVHWNNKTTNNTNNTDSPPVITTQTYNSDALSASFNYYPDQDADGKVDTAVKESGDKIYVYYTQQQAEQGQSVQEFTKDPKDTLEAAISKKFLSGISPDDCYVTDFAAFFKKYSQEVPPTPTGISKDIIAYPFPADTTQPYDANAGKCPEAYRLSNGLSYFYMDQAHPDKYYFFNIGQYGIAADKDSQTGWQDTFKVTK